MTVSKSVIDRINKIIFSFIWEGKPPKIKKKTIIGEKHCGALKMIGAVAKDCLDKAYRWIKY